MTVLPYDLVTGPDIVMHARAFFSCLGSRPVRQPSLNQIEVADL